MENNNPRNTNFNNIQSATIVDQKNLLASVFLWMFIGMVLTTISSLAFAYIPTLFDYMVTVSPEGMVKKSMLGHVIIFAPLIMLLGLGAGYKKFSCQNFIDNLEAFLCMPGKK